MEKSKETMPKRRRRVTAPASLNQRQLFPLLSRFPAANRAYNTFEAFHLRGPLDVESLGASFDAVVERHEALRTSLVQTADGVRQEIAPHRPGTMRFVDLSSLPPADRRPAFDDAALEETRRVFTASDECFSRFTLYRISQHDHMLLVVVHHLIFDGWSQSVLWSEVSEFYRARVANESPDLPEVRLQFADFVEWQNEWTETAAARRMADYWRREIDSCPEGPTLPYDPAKPEGTKSTGKRRSYTLSEEASANLVRTAAGEGVTVAALTLCALQLLIHRRAEAAEVVLGLATANRTRTETFSAIGFFGNIHFLRLTISGDMTLREVLTASAAKLLEVLANQAVTLAGATSGHSRVGSVRSARVPFKVMFFYNNQPISPLRLADISVADIRMDNGTRKTDMTLHVGWRGKRLTYDFQYNAYLYSEKCIDQYACQYEQIFRRMVAALDSPVRTLPL